MKTPTYSMSDLNILNIFNINWLIYILISLFIIFLINRYFSIKKNINNSFIKILSTIYIDSNNKIVILDLKKLILVIGITSKKMVILHTFYKKKNKIK
ncbi:flagellar biosynthetic protein FliO [Buchnera aphidicola]|uniref:flagellar biosynthetic protein FliO n=1 Tax=Buchnera aphidicola TaxID=9 RepID=UPI0031B8AF69